MIDNNDFSTLVICWKCMSEIMSESIDGYFRVIEIVLNASIFIFSNNGFIIGPHIG